MNGQMERYAGLEGSPEQGLLSLWSWGVPPSSRHMDVFTNPEAPRILSFRGFMEVSLHGHDWLNN